MISIGIDAGIQYTKVVALKNDGTYASKVIFNGLIPENEIANQGIESVLQELGMTRDDIAGIVKTGVSREEIELPGNNFPEPMCLAEGLNRFCPDAEYVMDTGTRKFLAARCREGKVLKYAFGERCASGAGAYLNMVSSFLRMELDKMNELYFWGHEDIVLETKCAVFAESEIISKIHNKIPVEEIVRGAFLGLAKRSQTPIVNIGGEKEIVVIGGVMQSPAYVDALNRITSIPIVTIPESQIVLAMGAAILAQRQVVQS